MSQAPKYPTHQNLPPAYERQVWPPEGLSEEKRFRMSRVPYVGDKEKMTKKARLRRRAYHHVLTRRQDGRVEVVMGDCVQGFRHNNVLPRDFRKVRSGWVNRATHGMNEQFQNASYERRLAPWGSGRDPEEVVLGDDSEISMDSVVVGGPDTHETATMVRDFMERQEVSRG